MRCSMSAFLTAKTAGGWGGWLGGLLLLWWHLQKVEVYICQFRGDEMRSSPPLYLTVSKWVLLLRKEKNQISFVGVLHHSAKS